MSDSLINKYRPQDFSSVVGHKQIISTIKNTIKNNLAHSFIFCGEPGIGKTTLARIIAREVGCKRPIEIDGASATGIDAIREITSTLGYKSMNGDAKVIIVDEAHRLSSAAITSLLKSIEEPQSYVYWVLATTELSKITKPIQTRCQIYNLKPLSENEIYGLLEHVSKQEGFVATKDVLEFISESSNGSARQALSLLSVCSNCSNLSEAKRFVSGISKEGEIIDLARFLVKTHNPSWQSIQKHLNDLKDENPESIRMTTLNYIAKVLMNTKDGHEAARLLTILNVLKTPYRSEEKFAPLIISLGELVFQ